MHDLLRFALPAAAAVTLTAGVASAQTFTVPLDSLQTNPGANFDPGQTLPTGNAVLTLDTDAMTFSWDIDYQDLTGPIVAPGAHVHSAETFGGNGPTVVDLVGDTPSGVDPIGGIVPNGQPATGNLTGTANIDQMFIDGLLGGNYYVNFHTEQNGPGELRGQIVVPEPASLGLLGAAGTLLIRRRR
ncbi:MAG: CHRD domain-containing protein [Planctomycetota bacterium]